MTLGRPLGLVLEEDKAGNIIVVSPLIAAQNCTVSLFPDCFPTDVFCHGCESIGELITLYGMIPRQFITLSTDFP